MVLICMYALLTVSLALIAIVFLTDHSDNDINDTVVDKIDIVLVDIDMDISRIKNMIECRDRYRNDPTDDNEIEYQIAQYYVWYHDSTTDGTQGRIVL